MNYSIISKYRTQLMGFATLWVALLHSGMWFSNSIFETIKITGHAGVDIFLFLSSFGLYYAWQKGERGKDFFFHRWIRILPAFVIVAVFRAWYMKYSLTDAILLVTTLRFWTNGDRSMWFISALTVLYAVTPAFLKWCEKGKQEQKTLLVCCISILITLLLKETHQMIFFARIPVFFLGFLAGKYSYEKRSVTKKDTVFLILGFIAGCALLAFGYAIDQNETILYGFGLYWYPNLLAVWGMCMALCAFFSWTEKIHFNGINSFFQKIGSVSLEFYLLHGLMITLWSNLITVLPRYNYHGILFNLLVIVLTVWFSELLQKFVAWMMSHLRRKTA